PSPPILPPHPVGAAPPLRTPCTPRPSASKTHPSLPPATTATPTCRSSAPAANGVHSTPLRSAPGRENGPTPPAPTESPDPPDPTLRRYLPPAAQWRPAAGHGYPPPPDEQPG